MSNPPTFTPPAARVEPSPRWVRTLVADRTVADSRDAVLHVAFGPPLVSHSRAPMLPGYFFPTADVDMDLLEEVDSDDVRRWWDVRVGDRVAEQAAWTYRDPDALDLDVTGHVTFRWEAMDAWFEEAEEVFFHARDPRKRIDVRASTRHVEVQLDGETLARSDRPHLLFETDLPTRHYLPRQDVAMDRLVPSDTITGCAYKGTARYFSLAGGGPAGADIAWSYPEPFADCPGIRDLVCFWNEKVDLLVDGEKLARPTTPWS